jgi:propionyl-CoA synthetase
LGRRGTGGGGSAARCWRHHACRPDPLRTLSRIKVAGRRRRKMHDRAAGPRPSTKDGIAMKTYQAFHRRSIEDRDGFWREEAKLVDWQTPFERVLDYAKPPFAKWFVGGRINLCHNAVDRHLATRGDQPALIYISTETGQRTTYTYKELHAEVNRCAAMLRTLGVGEGDRVLIYMPMIAEAAFAMLACARIGAIHSVVFGERRGSTMPSRW